MTTPDTDLPPYEPARMITAPFPERVRLVCRTWASQVFPNPPIVLVIYWLKYVLLFAGGWAFFVSFSAGYPGFTHPLAWAFMPIAFQKAIAWAIVYEIAGFGCSQGPMNARFKPPIGGLKRPFIGPHEQPKPVISYTIAHTIAFWNATGMNAHSIGCVRPG